MARPYKTVDYDQLVEVTIRLGDCVPPGHLARFVVEVIAALDLQAIYAQYGRRGAPPYAPEVLLALLFYGYATGVFSSRRLEQATYDSLPCRYIAGNMHPAHATLADFRRRFLPEITGLFTQVLELAQEMGVLQLGHISVDGSKIHADASKHQAISYARLEELAPRLHQEIQDLLTLAEQVDQGAPLPEGLVISEELTRRETRLRTLAEARQVLEARAAERDTAAQAAYAAKLQARTAREQELGHKLGGRPPQPPTLGVRPTDQYNFTDPDSRIMKNSTNTGFDQHYNVQVGVDHASLLVVGQALSNHPNDTAEMAAVLDHIPPTLGTPAAAAADNGYFSPTNLAALESRHIPAYVATGRDTHYKSWLERFAACPAPPSADASATVKMAYQLRTTLGQAVYRLRKCTVEPVIGIIKETLGFRQFSLRGEPAAAGEWTLVCLAFNLKRLHTLLGGLLRQPIISPTGC